MNQAKYKHRFSAVNGRPVIDYKDTFYREFEVENNRRGYIIVYWDDEEEKIEYSDLRYYFKVFISVLEKHHVFWGESPEQIHHKLMRERFGTLEVVNGVEEVRFPSITSLSKREFREYKTWLTNFMKEYLDCEPLEPLNFKL